MLDTLNGVYPMRITRTSRLTGKTSVMDLPITREQLAAWVDGELIQNAMPHLNADQREFVMTGITPDEWQAVFG
jgi:outer membrane biogenesis lipoprotein LolB